MTFIIEHNFLIVSLVQFVILLKKVFPYSSSKEVKDFNASSVNFFSRHYLVLSDLKFKQSNLLRYSFKSDN